MPITIVSLPPNLGSGSRVHRPGAAIEAGPKPNDRCSFFVCDPGQKFSIAIASDS